jgi:hypothetical protein
MTSEFNERLPIPLAEKAQIWIVGTREQVAHLSLGAMGHRSPYRRR